MNPAIQTLALTRRFGRLAAVDGVDLDVPDRAIYAFLGQNGAGKTTTIRLLLGLLKPTGGAARICGFCISRQRLQAARLVGALVETPCHYDHLTGRENLAITQRLLGAPASEIDRVLETVDLTHAADRRAGGYSLGMRQRLGVARALIGRPRILILDEPTNGLDPHGIVDMRRLIAELPEREGVTLFLSSHLLAEVEQTATHVGLMHQGRLLLQSPVAALRGRQTKLVRLRVDRVADTLGLLLAQGIKADRGEEGQVTVAPASAALAAGNIAAINAMLVNNGVAVSGVEVREPSLEDIFVEATRLSAPAANAPFPLAA